MDEAHGRTCTKELGTGTDNQRFESPGSDLKSSEGSHYATLAEWLDEESSYPGRQSQIAEVYGDEMCLELPASHKSIIRPEMYDPSVLPTELPILGSFRQRSSPELLHPINSESDRHSLWHRRRGMPAADRHCSDAKQIRVDRPNVDESENAISSSSWGPSKPVNSLHSVPADGDEAPADIASAEELKDPYTSWTSIPPMSHTTSSDTVAPTVGSISNVGFPGSPSFELASPSSNMFSPVSPIAKYVYQSSDIVSPITVTRNDTILGTIDRHEEAVRDWITLGLSPQQPTPEEPDTTRSTITSAESRLPILRPVSLHPFDCQFQFEESDAPPIVVQPRQSRTKSSSIESSTHSKFIDELSESETSSSMNKSIMTQVDTTGSPKPVFLPYIFPTASPQMSTRVESGFSPQGDISSPGQRPFHVSGAVHSSCCTRPAAAIHASSFSQAKTGDNDTLEGLLGDWKMQEQGKKIQDFDRSDEEQSLPCPDLQPWSPLDNLIATITSELNSTSPQNYPSESRRQPTSQHHSREIGTGQALLTETLPHCFNHRSLLVSNSAPKRIQVQELQELVRTVNTEWMQRMTLLPELWSRCSTLPADTLFRKGIWTLKEYISGRFARVFDDVFAFIHLAFASAFVLHRQHDFYSWNAFFGEALQWQHAFAETEDRILFLTAMNCWWLPEQSSPLLNSSVHTSFGSITPRGSLFSGDQEKLSDVLRNSEPFKVCICFLDGKLTKLS